MKLTSLVLLLVICKIATPILHRIPNEMRKPREDMMAMVYLFVISQGHGGNLFKILCVFGTGSPSSVTSSSSS